MGSTPSASTAATGAWAIAFKGRFKAILVERESYLLELCRYVVRNPVRARMVRSPAQYKWSSYRMTTGQTQTPTFLTTAWVLSQFGQRRQQAVQRYQAFVREGLSAASPWEQLRGQVVLGSAAFVERIAPYLKGAKTIKEVPRRQRLVNRPSLDLLFEGAERQTRSRRNRKIRQAHLSHGYTLAAIGRQLGLHYSTISKVVNAK